MAEWYTRWSQKPLDASPCEFDSHPRHQIMLATDLRIQTIFKEDNAPWLVTKYAHKKSARGGATVKVTAKNLLTNQTLEKSYSSNQQVTEADVQRKNITYLYKDSEYIFMDPTTFEQFNLPLKTLAETGKFLCDGQRVQALFFEDRLVDVTLPNTLDFEVTYTEPGFRGNTVSNVYKDATINNGTVVKVPSFIKIGDKVKIDTRSGEYVSKS